MGLRIGTDQGSEQEGKVPVAHFLVEGSKRAPHVGAHVTWGFIGDLDAGLQNGLWHNFGLQVMHARSR